MTHTPYYWLGHNNKNKRLNSFPISRFWSVQAWKEKNNGNNNNGIFNRYICDWFTSNFTNSRNSCSSITYCFKIYPRTIRWGWMGKWVCNFNNQDLFKVDIHLDLYLHLLFVLASFVYGLMLSIYPGYAFIEIGWRIMFFTGMIPGLIDLIIR